MSFPNIDIRSLRHILVLSQHQNSHRAAETLFVTQPALSKSIKNIECLLGVPLFDRLPQLVKATPYCD